MTKTTKYKKEKRSLVSKNSYKTGRASSKKVTRMEKLTMYTERAQANKNKKEEKEVLPVSAHKGQGKKKTTKATTK